MCWPQPPFHTKDYPALLELLGPEEFERRVCPLEQARREYGNWLTGTTGGHVRACIGRSAPSEYRSR